MKTAIKNIQQQEDYDYIYITEVHSNVKGLHGTYKLHNPLALLVGPNGAGKTALMNAITLAVFGEIYEAGARGSAKSWALLSHLLPKDQPLLFSKVKFSNGHECFFTAGPHQKPDHRPPPFTVGAPYEAAVSALKGSAETLMDFFYLYFCPAAEAQKTHKGFGRFTDLHREVPGAARRLMQKEAAKAKARQLAGEVKVFKTMIERIGSSGSTELLLELRAEEARAKAKLTDCKANIEAYRSRVRHWFDRNQLRLEDQLGIQFIEQGAHIYVARDGHVFTSGAETVALASTLVAGAPNAAQFNLVMLPDRLIGNEVVSELLGRFKETTHLNIFFPRLEWQREEGYYDTVRF